jgi:hypothetical protein
MDEHERKIIKMDNNERKIIRENKIKYKKIFKPFINVSKRKNLIKFNPVVNELFYCLFGEGRIKYFTTSLFLRLKFLFEGVYCEVFKIYNKDHIIPFINYCIHNFSTFDDEHDLIFFDNHKIPNSESEVIVGNVGNVCDYKNYLENDENTEDMVELNMLHLITHPLFLINSMYEKKCLAPEFILSNFIRLPPSLFSSTFFLNFFRHIFKYQNDMLACTGPDNINYCCGILGMKKDILSYEFCKFYITKIDCYSVRYIPAIYITDEIVEHCIKNLPSILLEDFFSDKLTKNTIIKILNKQGCLIRRLNKKFIDVDICRVAVKKSIYSIEDVPKEYLKKDLISYAITIHGEQKVNRFLKRLKYLQYYLE